LEVAEERQKILVSRHYLFFCSGVLSLESLHTLKGGLWRGSWAGIVCATSTIHTPRC
jgi:hypothetical protein